MIEIRVLIVEDEPITADDIADCLKGDDYQVSGIAYDYEDAMYELQNNCPDIVLLDIHLNHQADGIRIAEYINKHLAIPFVFLTAYSDKSTLEKVKQTGPMGYIVKPFVNANIIATLEIALYNFYQLNKTKKNQLDLIGLNKKLPNPLSEREFEVLMCIYDGKTNQQITEVLFISINTVKTHINNLYLKLDVTSRSQAMAKMREIIEKG